MRPHFFAICVILSLIHILFRQTVYAQGKMQKKENTEKTGPPVKTPADTTTIVKDDKNPIAVIKQLLTDDYMHPARNKQTNTGSFSKKQILNVGWFDSGYNKITATLKDEMISLAVLTKGYNIGDTVKITIAAKEGGSLMAGIQCNKITFSGTVNYEDLAFLRNVFSVQGEDEKMVIDDKWLDRYTCR